MVGVPRFSSDLKAIRKAYRARALQLHPDKNPSVSPEKFHHLNQAFLVLTTNGLKREYDETLLSSS